jgi:hypothetical protein
MRKILNNNKSGVSLIAVLLFMLIATIAATATWKWLSSEGFSSASRMQKREALQSAEAGIGATRAWMTFHANDVGALIKQYQDGHNQPIRIDNQLTELKSAKQNYSVWLVGVDTQNPTYKLKIISKGESRNHSAEHTEVAILKVDGLYKVNIPASKKRAKSDFDYAYFGSSVTNSGDMNPTSMLVNGNWFGNPNTVTRNFVVTGNAELSGNNVHVGHNACIGGNLYPNNGFTGENLNVKGDVYSLTMNISGDAYFEGSVRMGSQANPGFNVGGNVFLKDTMFTSQNEFAPTIHGNFCLDENALLFSVGTNNSFIVENDTWLSGPFNVVFGTKDPGTGGYSIEDSENIDARYSKINFKNVYAKYGHPFSDYTSLRENKTFTQSATTNKKCDHALRVFGTTIYCAEQKPGMMMGGTYENKWKTWEADTYTPYKWARTSADDKYYLYYTEPGATDVEYKSYVRNDLYVPQAMGWPSPSTVWGYYVGGEKFYYQRLQSGATGPVGPVGPVGPFGPVGPVGPVGPAGNKVELHPEYKYYHFNCTGENCDYEKKAFTGSPYCSRDAIGSANDFRPFCSIPSWFQVTGTFHNSDPTDLNCGTDIKDTCDDLLGPVQPGCDGAKYKVDDMLDNSYDVFKSYANQGCSEEITAWTDDIVSKLNTCYHSDEAVKFNDYLVVSVSANSMKNPTGTLEGKYVIIFENNPGQNAFPPTTDTSYVFLYLRKGSTGELQPKGAGTYNYFIYTDANVSKILFNNTADLHGTVYARAEKCAKVNNLTISKIETNQDLLSDLIENGVLCPSGQSDCGTTLPSTDPTTPTTTTAGETEASIAGATDVYYIAGAPQLKVSLESQYKNREMKSVPQNLDTLKSSFIVLPRVVYMTKDAKGSLQDYYGVIPLNSKAKVTNPSVTCNESSIKTSGALYEAGSPIREGYFRCNVTATVGEITDDIPFFVVVKGTLQNTTEVGFAQTSIELGNGATTTPKLRFVNGTPTQDYTINVMVTPADHPGWVITENVGEGECHPNASGVCQVVVHAGEQDKELFTVRNDGVTSGTLRLQITAGSGYLPANGSNTELIFVSSSVNVQLGTLAEYCNTFSCSEALQAKANTNEVPNCVSSANWVNISTTSSDGCRTLDPNHLWSCAIDGNIHLEPVTVDATKCEVVIPSENNSYSAPLSTGTSYKLYAGLKAKPLTLQYGFSGVAENTSEMEIDVEVQDLNGQTRNGVCQYSSLPEGGLCSITIYQGSRVIMTVPGTPSDFKRWSCDAGDCGFITNADNPSISFTAAGAATIYAHFNQTDAHCFFDQFKVSSLQCNTDANATNDPYCICPVAGTCGSSVKWNIVEGNVSDLELDASADKIRIKRSVARNKKESETPKVTVLSSVVGGLYGTLKAQFKIPKIDSRNSNIARTATEKTGFLLRSTATASSYLFVNVYLNEFNGVVARVCLNGTSCLESPLYDNGTAAYTTDGAIVLLTATLSGFLTHDDVLTVSVIPSTWSDRTYSATFALNNENITGVENLRNEAANQSIGYRLSDPNVELYGVGWHSEDFDENCWESFPSVKCSFKGAYAGGIVPSGTEVVPWVGLSAWFNRGFQCTPHYYYNGTDSENCTSSRNSDGFAECSDAYKFSETPGGAHGSGNKIAQAAVQGCGYITEEERQWASSAAECGEFWVGKLNTCSSSPEFALPSGGGDYWYPNGVESLVNLRAATLKIELNNPDANEIEISLFSRSPETSYTYGTDAVYSKSFKTNANGVLSIAVSEFSDEIGFDPEHVGGIYIHNLTLGGRAAETLVTSIMASCPYVLGFASCYANYSVTTGAWNVQGMINNSSRAGRITVSPATGATASMDGLSDECVKDGETGACSISNANGGTAVVFNLTDNPFTNNVGKEYQFKLEMWSNDQTPVAVEPCITESYPISSISAECSINKTSVLVGAGTPVVTYALSGCPDDRCGYEIYIDASTILAENSATGDFASYTTPTNRANTTAAPLTVGQSYTIKMRQKDAGRPFTEVTCGTFEVNDVSSQQSEIQAGQCAFSSSTISVGQTVNFFASQFTGTPQSVSASLLDPDGHEVSSTNSLWTGEGSSFGAYNLQPTRTGENTYTFVINGGVSCTATLTVNPPSATCTFSYTSLSVNEKLGLQIKNINPAATNLKLEVIETQGSTSTSKDLQTNYWSSNNYSQEFTMNTTGSYTYSVKIADVEVCSQNVTVSQNAISVSCPAKKEYAVGETATFNPTTLLNCGDGCDYVLAPTSGTAFASSTAGTYTSASTGITWTAQDATNNNVPYTFTVTDHSDNTRTASCTGTFAFVESVDNCGCTCSSGCDDLKSGTIENAQSATVCLFGTQITEINENWGMNTILVNGKRPQYCDGAASCNTALANAGVETIDGGYYIEIPRTIGCRNPSRGNENCEWIRVITTGSSTPVCSEESGNGNSGEGGNGNGNENGGENGNVTPDMTYSIAESKVDMNSGANVVQINSGLANPGGCQFGCDNGGANAFTIDIGTHHFTGQYSANGTIASSYCKDGTLVTVTLNASASNCHFNWWQ